MLHGYKSSILGLDANDNLNENDSQYTLEAGLISVGQGRVRLNFSRLSLDRWTIGGCILALLFLLPVASVAVLAIGATGDIWHHLVSTVLSRYLVNTALLMVGVAVLVCLFGISSAWLVTMCEFRGRRFFEWMLLLPLAMPAYLIAYAYTDFLDYPGPVQVAVRHLFGFESASDYWFPEVRSLGGATVFMGLVLYPYVYLLARTAFLEQSVAMLEASRVLGRGPWRSFFSVSLPYARPAIAVGVALALMETLNDYGTVDYFAIETLTVGVFDVWLGMNNLTGGAQIAMVMLLFVVALITLERLSRSRQRFYQPGSSRLKQLPISQLRGWRSVAAVLTCLLPTLFGFMIPVLVLLELTWHYFDVSWTPEFRTYALNSCLLSLAAALLTLLAASIIVYGQRLRAGRLMKVTARIASLGYAMPGAVLAIGIIVPFAAFDNAVDELLRRYLGISTGLLLSGTVTAVVFAYVVRFLAVSVGQVEASLEKISPSMDMAARTLGYRPGETFARYHLPLIRGGVFTALMIVFVDCMKELPATLILRPFNFDTLATHVYEFASDEMLGEAALGSLTIVVVGIVPVLLLSRMIAISRSARLQTAE